MLKKLLHNANTNDRIACLKDLQSNRDSGWICSKVILYNEVCSYSDTHRPTADTHGWTDTLFLCENMVKDASSHVVSLPSMAGIPVFRILVFLHVRSPVFSLPAVC